ncbi:MAG: VOC family protein [Candidatus Pacebacteria bacterium]|nr:VOC family protein [Candidatus Paceibacterota bacterium]
MQKIVPNLWFSRNASEAVDFYTSVFKDSKILNTVYYPAEGLADFQQEFAGKVLTIDFELNGQVFTAINAGDEFKFTEAISLAVFCKDQAEIDYYWSKLSAHPENEQCGWCKDKYGLSWQIVPENIEQLMKTAGAFEIMMQQKKIVIADYQV